MDLDCIMLQIKTCWLWKFKEFWLWLAAINIILWQTKYLLFINKDYVNIKPSKVFDRLNLWVQAIIKTQPLLVNYIGMSSKIYLQCRLIVNSSNITIVNCKFNRILKISIVLYVTFIL